MAMNVNTKKVRFVLLLTAVEGFLTTAVLLTGSSKEGAMLIGPYSPARALCAAFVFLIAAGCLGSAFPSFIAGWLPSVSQWLAKKGNAFSMSLLCLGLALFFFGAFLFTWLFFPVPLRCPFLWFTLLFGQLFFLLGGQFGFQQKPDWFADLHFIRWKELEKEQKKTIKILFILGLIYFLLFVPQNLQNAENPHVFSLLGGDEKIMYPILTQMFEPGENFRQQLYHLVIYEDYHYGYPFYVLSALVLIPSRIIFGSSFAEYTQVNVLLLRQIISVLPIIISVFCLTGAFTRFRSCGISVALFLFQLFMPGVTGYNLRFWHPDGLAVLCVVFVILSLRRDAYRLGVYFWLAAFFCGLANSVRLVGFFFFAVIAWYLLSAWLKQKIQIRQIFWRGVGFILVMFFVYLLTSPYLLDAGGRARFLEIVAEKTMEMRVGYPGPDPEGIYQTGMAAWLPFLRQTSGSLTVIVLVLISLGISLVYRREPILNGSILLFFLTYVSYLVAMVAVKSLQYLLPAFVPFMAAAFNIPLLVYDDGWLKGLSKLRRSPALTVLVLAVLAGLLILFGLNIAFFVQQLQA